MRGAGGHARRRHETKQPALHREGEKRLERQKRSGVCRGERCPRTCFELNSVDAEYSSSSCRRQRTLIDLKQLGFMRATIVPASIASLPPPLHLRVYGPTDCGHARKLVHPPPPASTCGGAMDIEKKRAWSVKFPLSHNALTPGLHSSSMLWSATVPLAAAARDKRERQRGGSRRKA